MLITDKGKTFEKPDSGLFTGVLADIVYIKDKPTKFGLKNVARLIWILDAKDKEGNYYRVMTEATQSLHENSRLFSILKDIRNGQPAPVPFDPDTLIGTVNQLVITREKSADGTKDFANIKAIIPASATQTFAVPQGFVRSKDKPAKGAQQSAPPQQATSAPVQSVAPAPIAPVAPVADEDIPF